MISFFTCLAILIIGYFTYGKYVDNIVKSDDRNTPAYRLADGSDYVPMGTAKVFLIQLLNIAGLEPIFGALAGAVWGPSVFLWITFGSVFAGAVHDFLTGMISERNDGATISEIVGKYLGPVMKFIMRIFSVILLILIGVFFTTNPALLLDSTTTNFFSTNFWLIVLILYYFIATFIPIDKVIGKIYPIFGFCLIFMAIGVITMLFINEYKIPEITLSNLHPNKIPIWPVMFINVTCGAISGFHATQSPLMARCMKSEKEGKKIFYGAMIAEGIITLIWAAAGCAFYNGTVGLNEALESGAGTVVYQICSGLMGPMGAFVAMIGVIACPVSSADTAYRSARLTLAAWFKYDQKPLKNRLAISIPLLIVGAILTKIDVRKIWSYFSWSNQTLAMVVLWACSVYLVANNLNYWIAVIPATFMSAVSCAFILNSGLGFSLSLSISCIIGIVFAIICFIIFWMKASKIKNGDEILADINI
ncbi:MAG: carbon starvation protein A [Fusobacteriaceae bacterium]|jgi:carbon starvation protein CstA|nr:carbon starvation protein A [Fusobacteriaceae bacterium]